MKRIRQTLFFGAIAFAASTVFAADYFVDQTGANGTFTTIQAAVNAVTGESELNRANIFIAPGIYHELVIVNAPDISLIGTGATPDAVKITGMRDQTEPSDDGWNEVFGVRTNATGFMARNITFENSTPEDEYVQALAARVTADRAAFVDVRFFGFMDTLLVDGASRHYFRDSFITGAADFIFGDATAVFDDCTIQSTDHGSISAPNTDDTTAIGLVFLDCTLVPGSDAVQAGGDTSIAADRTVNLSRPWQWWGAGKMPSTTFIRTRMGSHITALGWDPWASAASLDVPQDPHAVTRFAEFGSKDLNGDALPDENGDGKPNGRAAWADVMTAEQAANYTLDNIFGPADFWNSATQPQASAQQYLSQGAPWNVNGQLALLPKTAGPPARPLNLSTRLVARTGDNAAIAGFIVRGTSPKTVLLRALGPSLSAGGIRDAMANPALALRQANGELVAANSDWPNDQAGEISATGLAPSSALESAMVASVAPGAYTATVEPSDGAGGVALAEIYDLDTSAAAELANISTRGFVGTGDDVMIAGFILGGSEGSAKVLVRGIGPSLTQTGVAQSLSDPTLTLYDSEGTLIFSNNDWPDSQPSEIENTGIAPTDRHESAIVATLPAGSYTAVLAGNDGSGVGLIEVYALDK